MAVRLAACRLRAADGGQAGSGARIPAAKASFLGRAGEVAELSRLLEGERLVTLTGAPGIGKTRLAVELGEGFAGGAHVVELAPVARGGAVSGAVASALSVDEQPGQELIETISARLGERRLLLVLDNCEHLISGCVELAETLLSSCPQLRVLATSREPLGLPAERVWQVPPLAVPAAGEAVALETLGGYAAVGLFVERARAVQPGLSLNAYVAPAVAEIARRLDGIPLAIELAAARVESVTPAEIAQRLDDRFDLLTRVGGEPARHQTLEAALDWSHELLTIPERALLRRLSVFVGGFEVEAVEAVCAGGEVGAGQVRELLAELVAKSLVVVEVSDAPTTRYRLLETIRAYAGDRLEEAREQAELRGAHARFYLDLAERAEPDLTGPDQQDWLERLEAERANLRAAIEWSLGHGEAEQALRLAGALVLFWRVRCHFCEGRELLDAAVAVSDAAPVGLRAKALWGAGFMAHMMGDDDHALAPLKQSLSLFRELEDRQGCARALMVLANCWHSVERSMSLFEQSAASARGAGDAWCLGHALALPAFYYLSVGELPAARRLFEEALQVAREAGEGQTLRSGLLGLGAVALRQGELALAESLLEEALVVTGQLGEDYARAWSLHYLGELALARGDYARSRERLDEAVALARQIGALAIVAESLSPLGRVARAKGDRQGARRLFERARDMTLAESHAVPLQALGELAAEEGDAEAARRQFEEALRLARARGDKRLTADALFALGELARSVGERRRAAVLHDEALELRQTMGSAPEVVASLEAIAGLAAHEGRHEHAARLLGAAQAHREAHGWARSAWSSSRYEADLHVVRQAFTDQDFESSFSQGAVLSLGEAVAQASKGRGPRARPVSGWSSLTDTERQVAALAAEGLTNGEIAERRFITRGTVKVHMVHIFQKLGVARRTELPRKVWDSENGPASDT